MQRVATCCCKKSNIRVSGSPDIHTVCHCDNCKQRTGSAFGISAYFNIGSIIEKTENLSVYRFHHEMQNHDQERHFCSDCGTTLYWTISSMPNLIGIAGGCFTDQPLPTPSFSANSSSKYSWVSLPCECKILE